MSRVPDGLEAGRGLAGLVDGLLLWTIASVFGSVEQLLGSGSLAWDILAWLGFGAMVLFPLWFWVSKPIWVSFRESEDPQHQHVATAARAVPIGAAVVLVGLATAGWLPLAVEFV